MTAKTKVRAFASVGCFTSLLLLAPLSGCSSLPQPIPPMPSESFVGEATPPSDLADADRFGCSPEAVAYGQAHGLPTASPLDVDGAWDDFDLLREVPTPECFLGTSDGRVAMLWNENSNDVLDSVRDELSSAGFEQSTDNGPSLWWSDGPDPMNADVTIEVRVADEFNEGAVWIFARQR